MNATIPLTAAPVFPTLSPAEQRESRAEIIVAVACILTALSTIVFGIRLYIRCVILRTPGLDDWTMLAAQFFAIATGITYGINTKFGLGHHLLTPLVLKEFYPGVICTYIAIYTYNIGVNLVKISFLLQYRRIFPSQTLHRVCAWFLVIISVWTALQVALGGTTCVPLQFIAPETLSWCLDTLPIWEFTSIVNIFTDVGILMIPLPQLWKLAVPPQQKLVLFGIFGLGFLVCVVSAIRVASFRVSLLGTDLTWDSVGAVVMTLAEFNAAILCSSLPVLRPLFFKASNPSATGTGVKPLLRSGKQLTEHSSLELGDVEAAGLRSTAGQGKSGGALDSSEYLVTATYDEMMYGDRPLKSPTGSAKSKRATKRMAEVEGGDRRIISRRLTVPAGFGLSVYK